MKILIIKSVPGEVFPGNSSYNIQEIGIARAFSKKGFECDVMCCSNDGKYRVHSVVVNSNRTVRIFCMPSISILKNGWPKNADQIISGYDVIHVSEYNQVYAWYLAGRYPSKVIVWHGPYHDSFNTRYNAMSRLFDLFFLWRYKKLGTKFFAKSDLASEFLRSKGLVNVETVGVGLDTEQLSYPSRGEVENSILMPEMDSTCRLLYVGKLEKRRNVCFLLDVLVWLKKKIPVRLVIVGKGDDAYIKRFWARANELGVADSVIHIDFVPQGEIFKIYKSCDVFVFPSKYDIFGMVLLEAMYFGKLVVSSRNGGSSMLINDGMNGVIVNGFDAKIWGESILGTLTQGRRKMEMEAELVVEQKFTWDAITEKMVDLYRKYGIKCE